MRTAVLIAAAAALAAPPPMNGHVMVTNGWFRALPAGLPAAGYFELRNLGKWPVTLTGAESRACGMLMLHESKKKNGVGSMGDLASVDVPAHETVRFSPGGYHLMCMDPGPQIKPGRVIAVTLRFSDTTTVATKFAVKNAKGQ